MLISLYSLKNQNPFKIKKPASIKITDDDGKQWNSVVFPRDEHLSIKGDAPKLHIVPAKYDKSQDAITDWKATTYCGSFEVNDAFEKASRVVAAIDSAFK